MPREDDRMPGDADIDLADLVEFTDNPEPRCACVLLLDTSGSMHGSPIRALNEGIRAFQGGAGKRLAGVSPGRDCDS